MKAAFLVKGPGEYAQAYAVGKAFQDRNFEPTFIIDNQFLQKIIEIDGFSQIKISDPESANHTIASLMPDILFLCNSHTAAYYNLDRPDEKIQTCSLDSNWLFNNKRYVPTSEWIDKIFCLFPHDFFESNLTKNGGKYEIDPLFMKKIFTPGFVPSGMNDAGLKEVKRKELGLNPDEKLIATYFSRPEFHSSSLKSEISNLNSKIIQAISNLNKTTPNKLHTLSLATKENTLGYVFKNEVISTVEFDLILSASDLVVMHYGYGTLPKIFNNQIPVICFMDHPQDKNHSNYFELYPCITNGLIENMFFDDPVNSLESNIQKLLFDAESIKRMKNAQKKIFIPGEDNLIKELNIE